MIKVLIDNNVELVYQDTLGSVKAIKVDGAAAYWICQAMDTIDGLFASDYGLEVIPEFDAATDEDKNAVFKMYLDSIPQMFSELDKELSNDPKTRKGWDATKFMQAAKDGKVEFDKEENKPLSKRKQKLYNKFAKLFKQNENKLKFWRKK